LKPNNSKSLSVVIPAYNEEDSIDEVICNTFETLPYYFVDFEVIVVNDGSTDKTAQILNQLTDKFRNLRVIEQSNCGFGIALMVGVATASKDYAAYLPADGQFLVSDMRHCFELIENSDLLLGYRGGRSDYTLARIVMSYGYLTLLTFMFGIRYMDVGWVHIWRTSKIKELGLKGSRGIFVLTEIVVRFRALEYRILEGPSYYHPRIGGQPKNASLIVVVDTFFQALRLFFRLWRRRRN
jgi:glycosyltransferase involved in cell wall biosynthesis